MKKSDATTAIIAEVDQMKADLDAYYAECIADDAWLAGWLSFFRNYATGECSCEFHRLVGKLGFIALADAVVRRAEQVAAEADDGREG